MSIVTKEVESITPASIQGVVDRINVMSESWGYIVYLLFKGEAEIRILNWNGRNLTDLVLTAQGDKVTIEIANHPLRLVDFKNETLIERSKQAR